MVAVLPGGAEHPLWGASDRIVGETGLLTVSAALDWDRIGSIPALADPTRLPPGAGSAILNLIAGLAAEQGAATLRYRGPYATEQLFWTLAESFRFDAAEPDPLGAFLDGAEAAFLARRAARGARSTGRPRPTSGSGRTTGSTSSSGTASRRSRGRGGPTTARSGRGSAGASTASCARSPCADGGRRFVAGLVALGRPLEDHLVLDENGEPADRAAPEPRPRHGVEAPLAPVWREALASLVPLDATPLLTPALAAAWPAFDVGWGPVARDLVEARGSASASRRRSPGSTAPSAPAAPAPRAGRWPRRWCATCSTSSARRRGRPRSPGSRPSPPTAGPPARD